MAIAVECNIVSAEKLLYSGLVETVQATGEEGELGIYLGHAPLLTKLVPGPVRIVKQGGEEDFFYVSGGMLEVQPNMITILADTGIRAHDLDEAAASEAKAKAEQALLNRTSEIDYAAAAAQLAEAAAILRTMQKMRRR